MRALARQCPICEKMQPHQEVTVDLRLKFDPHLLGQWHSLVAKGLICEGCGHVQMNRETSQEFLGMIRGIMQDEHKAAKIREEENFLKIPVEEPAGEPAPEASPDGTPPEIDHRKTGQKSTLYFRSARRRP